MAGVPARAASRLPSLYNDAAPEVSDARMDDSHRHSAARALASLLAPALLACAGCGVGGGKGMSGGTGEHPGIVERVGDFAVVPLEVEGFERLDARQRSLAYYLVRAAIAGRDIYYDQMGRDALETRDLLEEILTHPRGLPGEIRDSILKYLKLFWLNNGNHNDRTRRKFVPGFTPEQLRGAAQAALREGARFHVAVGEGLDKKLARLAPYLFDLSFEPLLTCKTPPAGQDILTCSSVNYYEGLTLREIEGYREAHPLNSRLTRRDGRIAEEVWRAGRGDLPPGRYAVDLKIVNGFLAKAESYAPADQKAVLARLSDFFATGDPADFRQYNLDWVRLDPKVDGLIGFIETYKDPRGQKGGWQGLVYAVDEGRTRLLKALAAEAPYFEERAPWDDKYKRRGFTPPVAAAAQVLIAVGDAGPSPPIGVTLPNDDAIAERVGSRSLLFTNVLEDSNRATLEAITRAFALPEDQDLLMRHAVEADMLLTALHEVLGHAAGKTAEGLTEEPQARLREHYATIEEARAELVALHTIFDPRLREIGALSAPEVAEAAYRDYLVQDLSQLRRVRDGVALEDDHMRATHLIVSWLLAQDGGVEKVSRDGRTYLRLADAGRMRQGVARLLAEVQRIKSEGDAAGARDLVERFADRFDPRLRDEVAARAEAAGLSSFLAYVMPNVTPVRDPSGEVVDAKVGIAKDFGLQMLQYAGKLPLEPTERR